MKKHTFAAALCGLLTLTSTHLSAQEVDDKYVENDVVSLAGKKGFSFSTKAGDFLFKPYALYRPVPVSTDMMISDSKLLMPITSPIPVLPFQTPYWDLPEKHSEK